VTSASGSRGNLVDWFLRDRRSGRLVVAQWPNIPLVLWFVASAVPALLGLDGGWGAVMSVVAVVALGWWAIDEMARGVNPWRRLLGAVVFAALVATRTTLLL
jgi:hypothetical protein